MNADGFANLMRLSKVLNFEPSPDEPAHVKIGRLEEFSAGLIALTGGPQGPIDTALRMPSRIHALERLKTLEKIFRRSALRRNPTARPSREAEVEPQLIELAYARRLPLVATNECYFATRADYEAHDALLCIADGRYVVEDDRRRASAEHYLKSEEEMVSLFADLPEASANTIEIAIRCAFRPEGKKPILAALRRRRRQSERDRELSPRSRGA